LLSQTQLAFALGLLLGQYVIEVGLGTIETALTRPAKELCGAPVGFHLRHFVYSSLLAMQRTTIVAAAGGY
jgi:hypothetical protein